MATKPKVRTLTNSSADVLNAIRNSASINYRNYVPVVTPDADSIREIGAIIMDMPALQNEFLSALVNRIGKVIITSKSYSNPWAMFKKGFLDFGETVEEVFVSMARPFQYDPEVAEKEVFKREIPDVQSAFHVMNYQKFYKATTEEQDLRLAFLSEDGVYNLVAKITEQLYTAMENDEFLTMKYMLARNLSRGQVSVQTINTSNIDDATVAMRKASNDLLFMSDEYNLAGVTTHTLRDDQYIIINTAFDATQSVKNLARAFNMSEAELLGHIVLVDGFGKLNVKRLGELFKDDPNYYEYSTDELAALNEIPAVLVDRDYFVIYDKLQQFRDLENVQGLYWNHYLHVWKLFSVSPFANAIAFIPNTPTVTGVTVSPATATVSAGQVLTLTAKVATTNFAPQAVTWTSDNPLVTVSASGVVKVDPTASGTANITATSKFDTTKSGQCVITVQ